MDDFTWFSPTDYFYAGCCWRCVVDRHHTTQIFCSTSGGDQLFLANDAGFYAFLFLAPMIAEVFSVGHLDYRAEILSFYTYMKIGFIRLAVICLSVVIQVGSEISICVAMVNATIQLPSIAGH
jgi:hypothetical protein